MSGRLPYVKRRFYPHMIGEDAEIWNLFVSTHPERFETVDYDFRVGTGAETPVDLEENYKRMITMLSQKRIDVIGWVGDHPTIIEVKFRVGLSTLGQVLGYRDLFVSEFKFFGVPELLVITKMINSDDRYILDERKIEIIVV